MGTKYGGDDPGQRKHNPHEIVNSSSVLLLSLVRSILKFTLHDD